MTLGRQSATGKGISGCVSSVSGPSYFYMEWNAEGQLKRVLLNSNEVARFTYDPLGRRVEKVAGGVTTTCTHKDEDILREVRGATTLKYIHGPGIDEPLAQEDGTGALTYYHTDGLGSIAKRTSQAGAVVRDYRYDTWGKIEAGVSEPGYSFTGREWDAEIGLYYYRARYYDPKVGRFVSEDPLGSLSFIYVGNDPVMFVDPSGLRRLSLEQIIQLVWANNLSNQPGHLIICVIWNESSFNPDAQNGSHVGLMQVGPNAAREAGFDPKDMKDPAQNIQAGSKYLQIRIRRAGGDLRKALAGYGTQATYPVEQILDCEECLLSCEGSQDPQACLERIHP
jgi:RHS repeat-associated protein